MKTVESIIASLKAYGKLNETTYVQQYRINFWEEQLRLIRADQASDAFARLIKWDDDYHEQFEAVAQSVLNHRQRIWAMDSQLNSIQRLLRSGGLVKPVNYNAISRIHFRLISIADQFERK